MIMEWKKQGTTTYQAIWRGTHLTLSEDPTTKRWHMLADGKTVRQTWTSSRKAMEDVERQQQRIVMQAVVANKERQLGNAASA